MHAETHHELASSCRLVSTLVACILS